MAQGLPSQYNSCCNSWLWLVIHLIPAPSFLETYNDLLLELARGEKERKREIKNNNNLKNGKRGKKKKKVTPSHDSCWELVHGEITHVDQPHQLSAAWELQQQLLQLWLCPLLLCSQVDTSRDSTAPGAAPLFLPVKALKPCFQSKPEISARDNNNNG